MAAKKKAVKAKKSVRQTARRKTRKVPPVKIQKQTSSGVAVDIPNDNAA